MFYVGIDVAKYKHTVAIIDEQGCLEEELLEVQNNYNGFSILLNRVKQLAIETEQIQIGLEDTGHYSLAIFHFLKEKGYSVFNYNPILIKEFSKTITLRKIKTDKKDALIIAKKLLVDFEKREKNITKTFVELKELTRHRNRFGSYQATIKVQYTRILETMFPELATWGKIRYSNYIIELLKHYPSPQKIKRAHWKKLTKMLGRASNQLSALEMKKLAEETIGFSSDTLEFELLQTIQLMEFYNQKIKEIDKRITEWMKIIDSPILTIPGISYRLGSIIVAEIGDINNFQTPAQVLAFAGMEPSIYSSGEYEGGGRMVKRGSPHLRWAMYQAARLISIYSPQFNAYYKKKLAEGKHHNVVLSHVAKKLVRIIFHLLKVNEAYKEPQ